jgi:hypothetical protein
MERLLMTSHKLAVFVSVVLSAATLLLVMAAPGEKASAMPVPDAGLMWDTAITGVIEELGEASPQGDTHAVVQDGNLFPIQSDVVDLSYYVGEPVTVYIDTLPAEDGSEVLNVTEVGPPEDFSAAIV